MRTRGSYELSQAGGDPAVIARKLGVGVSTISLWRSGDRTPSDANRVGLRHLLGIPDDAWDQDMPEVMARPVPPHTGPEIVDLASARVSVVAEAVRQMAIIRQTVDAVASDPMSSPYEIARVMASTSKSLAVLGKLTGSTLELSPTQVRNTPAWQRLEEVLAQALRDWPDALHAVREALAASEARS
jgi:transcriptional regulator with XRE-family HTH domain